MDAHFYNVQIEWNKDRKGVMCSPELNAQPRVEDALK